MANEETKHWSSFWDQGYITTFGDSKPRNYDGVVLEFWEEKFRELPSGARILDIAAGNGAIATIAAQVGRKHDRSFFVAATDIADIHAELVGDEETKLARKSIEFHSRTPCERQPFDSGYFNIVTSQFGFEYSDIEKTLGEIRRVLMPGGKFVAVGHHVDSTLIRAAEVERDIYFRALDELDVFAALRRYLEAIGEPAEDPKLLRKALKKARPLSDAINSKMDEFRSIHGSDERSIFIVGVISYIVQNAMRTTLAERLAAVDETRNFCQHHRARLNDMVNAALDQQKIDALTLAAHAAGFESAHSLKLFAEDNQLAGWQIHLR